MSSMSYHYMSIHTLLIIKKVSSYAYAGKIFYFCSVSKMFFLKPSLFMWLLAVFVICVVNSMSKFLYDPVFIQFLLFAIVRHGNNASLLNFPSSNYCDKISLKTVFFTVLYRPCSWITFVTCNIKYPVWRRATGYFKTEYRLFRDKIWLFIIERFGCI